MDYIANNLKIYRAKTGIKQEALADAALIARSTLSEIEAGKYYPRLDVAIRLARALSCTVEDLWEIK